MPSIVRLCIATTDDLTWLTDFITDLATTSRVYLVDSEGNHQELNTGEDSSAQGQARSNNTDTLSILGRLLGRGSLRAARTTARLAEEDDEDDEEEEGGGLGMFQYGFRGGRKTADGLFPAATKPVEEGIELERKGLFGRVSEVTEY